MYGFMSIYNLLEGNQELENQEISITQKCGNYLFVKFFIGANFFAFKKKRNQLEFEAGF